MLSSSTSCGAVPQVPIHTLAEVDAPIGAGLLRHATKMSIGPAKDAKAVNECCKERKRLEADLFFTQGLSDTVGHPPFLSKHFE
jgi:hypothetical protein